MHILEASIVLIGLVILSNILSHYLVSIPTALIEISVGLIVALVLKIEIPLEADWFMLLFVAPLLFNDAKRFPRNELWDLKAPIFANAIILVLVTTILGGFFVHWLIPFISLPLAMALVAVLSPTDPVAVHGIAERVNLPKQILSLISGESLINDASGLIAFKYALAAFLTGYFSLKQATVDFFYMSIFGVVMGYLFITFFHFLRIFLVQQGIRDVILHTTIRILMPFIIFLVTDEILHASGVIAVVTAGVISIYQAPIFKSEFSEVRLITHKMWDILIYLLNGIVFVILGAELPMAMSETLENPNISNWILILYIMIIWLILLIIRVVWSYSYLWISYLTKKSDSQRPHFMTALLTGLTGVRGAITMATIMSIPFYLDDGKFFVQRSLIIFLACGVVLMSLLVATITLPILTKQRERLILVGDDSFPNHDLPEISGSHPELQLTEIEARKEMLNRAIETLKQNRNEENGLVVNDLLHEFENRKRFLFKEQNDEKTNEFYSSFELETQLIAINGEYQRVASLRDSSDISHKSITAFLKIIRLKKQILGSGLRATFTRAWLATQKQFHRFLILLHLNKKEVDVAQNLTLLTLEKESTKGAIQALVDYKKTLDATDDLYDIRIHIINQLIAEYRNRIERIKHLQPTSRKTYNSQLNDLYLKALDAERNTIQELIEKQAITLKIAQKLRQSVNSSETSFLQR